MIKKESVMYSLRNLKNRKTRSFLTLFSIMMGIMMIFVFVSFGLGLYNYIENISTSSSANKIFIQPKGIGGIGLDTTFSFSEDDLKAVQRTSGVYDASGIYFKTVEVKQDKKLSYTYLIAYDPVKPLLIELFNLGIFKGRELKPGDRGVVLGYNYLVSDKIFPKPYSVNQNIEINGQKFKIVGFYESIGNPTDDSQIYISNDMMKEIFGENISYNWIVADADISKIDKVVDDITKNLRRERGIEEGKEDFFAQTYEDMIASYSSILQIVVGFIILIALISIFVSAVNTANTMVTSVLERTKEIGIIKSVGGTNAEIFGIFLFESAFLGFVGGVIGVLFGFGLTSIGARILEIVGYNFLSPYYSFWLFFGCVAFAVVTGAISGVAPAIKATKVRPINALRYE